jgi:hypothetical protein
VRLELEGDSPYKEWRNQWTGLQKTLFEALVSLKPAMFTFGARDKGLYKASLRSSSRAISISDGEEEEDVRMSEGPETPSKKRKVDDTPMASPTKSNGVKTHEKTDKDSPFDFSQHKTKFQLDNVAQHLEENSNDRIPGRIEPKVLEAMYLEPLQLWHLPVGAFFKELEVVLMAQIKKLFDKHFDKWTLPGRSLQRWRFSTCMSSGVPWQGRA